MRGKAVAQGVRVYGFLESGATSSSLTGMVDRLGSDGPITGVSVPARKQPHTALSSQAAPVLAQFYEQLGAEQHISVSAAFATLNVNHHALAVDIADFQAREFGTPESGGIERHEQSAMQGRLGRINEPGNFFLAENRWQVNNFLRVGSLFDAPGSLESLGVEESQSREALRHRVRRELPFLEQRRLIFTNVSGAQTIRRTVEVSREIFDTAKVAIDGSLGVITTLEFLQHHFS